MAGKHTRRGFVKGSLAAAGLHLALSLEEQVLLAQEAGKQTPPDKQPPQVKPASKDNLPAGTLGNLKISRIVLGGNLIGGWAHSRDLIYVSALLKHYFTEDKILDTMQIAEEHGVTCINTHPDSGPVIQRYRKERKGKMLWLVQGFPDTEGKFIGIQRSIDQGADAVYVQGNVGDQLIEQGKIDVLDKALRFVESKGLPGGIGSHSLAVPIACEKAALKPDFYVKTLHTNDYFSARRPDQTDSVIHNRSDNYWCTDPGATIEFMKKVQVPWFAFKVMAAGAIPPRKAFQHAFANGADFILAGMFDFQIAEDVRIAREVLAKVKRERPWRA